VFEACDVLFVGFCGAGGCRLMGFTADNGIFNAVDLYNCASGTWSTAQLSVSRSRLAATSVGNVAIFAGGWTSNCSVALFVEGLLIWLMRVCDCVTFVVEACGLLFFVYVVGRLPSHEVTAGDGSSDAVDLYNGALGTWSTAQLSAARCLFAATYVGNVGIFAGGYTGNCSLTLVFEGLLFGVMRVGDCVTFAWLRHAACCFVVYAVQEVAVSWGSLQVMYVLIL
jgi:hypothetical protein